MFIKHHMYIYIYISTVKCSWIATVSPAAKVDEKRKEQHNTADTNFKSPTGYIWQL